MTVASPPAWLISQTRTLQPSLANVVDMPAPKPEPPPEIGLETYSVYALESKEISTLPVTIATFPSSLPMAIYLGSKSVVQNGVIVQRRKTHKAAKLC